ncbi:MAG TPA: site-specific integrase, partial [Dehalococcoidia bacterium]|nr:site-specific integrase [Dehalococcoidia bacterium]
LATGARVGEVLALRWSSMNLAEGRMEIIRSHRFFKGRGIVAGSPKTHRSRRPVALSAETVRVLEEHRRSQLEHRILLGPAYDSDADLVFANPLGKPLYDSTVRRAFYAIVRQAGVGPLRIHDLRHSSITLMLRAKVPVLAVSQRVGHAVPSFTLGRYGHVLEDEARQAAAALDSILVGRMSATGP